MKEAVVRLVRASIVSNLPHCQRTTQHASMSAKADNYALSIGRISEWTSRSGDHRMVQVRDRTWPVADGRDGRFATLSSLPP